MSINALTKRRIMKLIAFMEALPKQANKHFDMGSYLCHWDVSHKHKIPETTNDLLHSCGTTACALGYAATMPYFRKIGIRFDRKGHLVGSGKIVPTYSARWSEMFGPWNNDRTPKSWAKRARKLLDQWSAA